MAEVVTTGSGEIERVADQASLQLRYTGSAKDRTGAVNELAKVTKVVEPLLDRPGVTVRSRQLFVHDRWDGKRRTGAQANQSYDVLVTDVEVLNDLAGDLIATEPAHLIGPAWGLADRSAPFRDAQRSAVEDARDRAQGYADALGGRLGTLVKLEDGSGGVRHMPFAARDAAMSYRGAPPQPNVADLSLEPQLVTVPASCTVTWELLV